MSTGDWPCLETFLLNKHGPAEPRMWAVPAFLGGCLHSYTEEPAHLRDRATAACSSCSTAQCLLTAPCSCLQAALIAPDLSSHIAGDSPELSSLTLCWSRHGEDSDTN